MKKINPDPGPEPEQATVTVSIVGGNGSVQPDSAIVALNDPFTFTVTPNSGYAVDTIMINGTQYVNNGSSEPPYASSWVTVTVDSVSEDLSISVSFSICTDDSGIPDKYKHTVIASAGPGGKVSPESQLVVYGHDATITITPNEGMAVDSIQHGEETYVNNPNFGNAIIEDSSDIEEALADPDITEMTLNAPLDTTSEIQITKPMTLNGAGNTVTKSEPGKAFTFTQDSTVEDITIENTADNTEWNSSYGIQFYTGEHTVKNATLTGGNAGIIANSATVNLEGTIDVSGNTFGGIEVCKSGAGTETRAAMPAGVLNINGASIINTTEEYGKPTIWIDGNTDAEGIVNGAEAFTMIQVPHGVGFQKHFYLDVNHSKPIVVGDKAYGNLTDAIAAVPSGTETTVKLMADITVNGVAVEIPSGKKVIFDLNSHTISSEGFKGRPIINKGTLTVSGNGKITSEGCGANGTGAITNQGTLTIENGTFSGGDGANGMAISNGAGATCTIKDGEIIGCPRGIQNLGTLTVDGGTFTDSDTYSGNEGNAIINAQGATCTINDGTFTGHMNAVSNMDNGSGCKLIINGGTFTTDGFESSGAVYNGTGNTVTIENGTFTTEGDSGSTLANRGTATVNGGTFIGDNCNKQCYTVDSGQTTTPGATMELGENVTVTGTFGAVRAVSGELTIKGGSYQVVDCSNHNESDFYALYVASEKGAVEVNIEDGTFQSLSNDCVRCGNPGFDSSAVINISGGSFTAPSGKQAAAVSGTGEISITGGNFSSNVQDFISESSSIEEQDGRFIVATN